MERMIAPSVIIARNGEDVVVVKREMRRQRSVSELPGGESKVMEGSRRVGGFNSRRVYKALLDDVGRDQVTTVCPGAQHQPGDKGGESGALCRGAMGRRRRDAVGPLRLHQGADVIVRSEADATHCRITRARSGQWDGTTTLTTFHNPSKDRWPSKPRC